MATYKQDEKDLMSDLMKLSVLAPLPYSDVIDMTFKERTVLMEVLQERMDANSPNKQRQTQMQPGKINGPADRPQAKSQQR